MSLRIFRINISIVAVLLSFFYHSNVFSQTTGSMTFTFNNPKPGNNASKNVMAIWIEDANGNFVKTRCRYWGNKTKDHLPSWKSKSSQNTVDAVTGATLFSTSSPTAFGDKTITWDGTDADGNVVADGTYKILVESSWCNPEPADNQHKFLSTFTFEKGSTTSTVSPSDTNLNNINIEWKPGSSGVKELENDISFSIYPNPTAGQLNIKFDSETEVKLINITSLEGKLIYTEKIANLTLLEKQLDIEDLANGPYYLEIVSKDGSVVTKSFIFKK